MGRFFSTNWLWRQSLLATPNECTYSVRMILPIILSAEFGRRMAAEEKGA